MMQPPATQKQLLAWIVLIFGILFLLYLTPSVVITVLLPFWKPEDFSMVSAIFTMISLSLIAVTAWAMKRAYRFLKSVRLSSAEPPAEEKQPASFLPEKEPVMKTKKLIWPWLVIGPGALLLIGSGPGAIMLPIAPLFLAAMSTDSGNTPDYVPFFIVVIGYGLMLSYAILLFFAIKALRAR